MKIEKWFLKDTPKEYADIPFDKPNPFYTDQIYRIVLGPKDINQPSGRLDERYWNIYQLGEKVYISGSNGNKWEDGIELFDEAEFIKELWGTFDQLGRPIVIYRINTNKIKLYWYNSLSGQTEIRDLTTGTNPFADFDMIHRTGVNYSDVLLFYRRNNKVYMRVQRERFDIEYETPLVLEDDAEFVGGGLTTDNRFQVVYRIEDKT